MKKAVLFIFLIPIFTLQLWGEPLYTYKDSLIYERYIKSMKADSELAINELLIKTALYFKESPYKASTLEKTSALENIEKEQLAVNLREFDCTTFIESCIALTRTLKSGDYSFSNFCNQLQLIRYRGGQIDGYKSRLHYVTDWAFDNQKDGILTDMSIALGGISEPKQINFMSSHPDSYKQLKGNVELQRQIKNIEAEINSRNKYSYIKKTNIEQVSYKIENGDIIVFATTIPGLDYSHMGLAYREGEKLTFIHASTRKMKVTVESLSLSDYCKNSSKCSGISILRLNK